MSQPTIGDVVQFILENRRNSYGGWTENEIVRSVKQAIEHKSFAWSIDKDTGSLNGICVAIASHDTKHLHIVGIILLHKYLMKDFIEFAQKNFPNYTITGLRKRKCIKNFTRKLTLLKRRS